MGTNITNQKSKETTKWQDSTIWQCRKTLPKTTVYHGLCSKTKYDATGSLISGSKREYTAEAGGKIERALKASADKQASLLAAIGKLPTTTLGNYLLEECHSADSEFAALQLFQYSHMSYQPVSSVCVFEGNDAKTVVGSL